MRKIIPFLVIIMFASCKNKIEAEKGHCPETTITFDYELRDIYGSEKFILPDQEIPNSPDCILKPGDTLRLCKSYGESDWHVEPYYKDMSEVDHCEHLKNAILISIKKVNYHYKE